MPKAAREEFGEQQKNAILSANMHAVQTRWPELLGLHLVCESCAFVSQNRDDFEIDHVLPCTRGGRAETYAGRAADPDRDDPQEVVRAGDNAMVLCRGCNQAKKGRQFVPPGAGYAYQRPGLDQNPDHAYHGPPSVSREEVARHPEPSNPGRYRRR